MAVAEGVLWQQGLTVGRGDVDFEWQGLARLELDGLGDRGGGGGGAGGELVLLDMNSMETTECSYMMPAKAARAARVVNFIVVVEG